MLLAVEVDEKAAEVQLAQRLEPVDESLDVQVVARIIRAVFVAGGRTDGIGLRSIRVGVAHRAGVACHGLNAAVTPGDGPVRDRVLSWIARGEV